MLVPATNVSGTLLCGLAEILVNHVWVQVIEQVQVQVIEQVVLVMVLEQVQGPDAQVVPDKRCKPLEVRRCSAGTYCIST